MSNSAMQTAIDEIFREDGRRIFATLVRLLGDFDIAEDALLDAFTAALHQWPQSGIPQNPRAWLVSAGRFKAIDALRKRARFAEAMPHLAEEQDIARVDQFALDDSAVEDDTLRLIFTCSHPLLAPEAQIALTLREVCGLTTEQIAHAFLTSTPTVAQRIVRAKNKIRTANIPYVIPEPADLPVRLQSVLHVVYLVFNEGYSASSGDSIMRAELSEEAIRLGRLLLKLMPDPDVMGLLSLMLISESRRRARAAVNGDLVLLEDQDRTLWNRALIKEGIRLLETALPMRQPGRYTLQAAIAAVHAEAATPADTDWAQIVALYDVMMSASLDPVVALNRAVAVAMASGPQAGLDIIEELLAGEALSDYHLAYSARAELYRRLGRSHEARRDYERALGLTQQQPERRFFERRLAELL